MNHVSRTGALLAAAVLLASCATLGPSDASSDGDPGAAPPPTHRPRTILLGFDGLDPVVAAELMDAGRLPHMSRLAASGGGAHDLGTAFPPQSPVSWANFNTAANPGRHGVAGFVLRGLTPAGPMPLPNLGTPTTLSVDGPDGPEAVPYEINPSQLDGWRSHLDQAGVRFTGVQLGSVFPPDREGPNTRLLAGLGLKDIGGSPGSWSVYTDDPWSYDKGTSSGGRIRKIFFEERSQPSAPLDTARVLVNGPRDWRKRREYEQRLAALEGQPGYDDVAASFARWQRRSSVLGVELLVTVDRVAERARFYTHDGAFDVELGVGEWSGMLPVAFVDASGQASHGLLRVLLQRCDEDELRFLTPPIMHDPAQPPEHLPLSAPAEFVSELAAATEPFETLGWACLTNPLKDAELDAQDFLVHAEGVMARRASLLRSQLDAADSWDVYTQVFSVTDRVSHMLFRERDPLHPAHNAVEAARLVTAFGAEFPLSDAVARTYEAADAIIGEVLERMDAGELGDDCLLLVFSDHGFQPFRRQVNLNTLLHEAGYLALVDDVAIEDLRSRNFLQYVDWSRTRAYSLGLGKIFLNLEGREPAGIVAPAEAETLTRQLAADLQRAVDPVDGTPVFTSLVPRDELFHGPFVEPRKELPFRVAGELQARSWDGFADLFAGFAPGYRISWDCTMGGISAEAVTDNTNRWSGGHVSVDPSHVPGILLSSRPVDARDADLLDLGPTVLRRHGVDPSDLGFDGAPLSLR